MGRPLNKKYFGNRNIGSISTVVDNGIGGQGVASAAIQTPSSYTVRPSFAFSAPTLPNGVTAAGTITSEVNIISSFAGGTNYTAGDTITIGNGTVFTVGTVNGGGVIQTITTTTRGVYPYAAGALPTGAQATTIIAATNPLASGATLTVNYHAAAVLITEPGSGYEAAPTIATGPSQGVAINAITLTTNPAPALPGTNGTQEPAITATAFTVANSQPADITKQVSGRRYKVRSAEGTAICKLVTATPAAVGQMTITATDSGANAYYVTKLTAHKALLVPTGAPGHEFPLNADGTAQSVKWTFGTAATGVSVKIANK